MYRYLQLSAYAMDVHFNFRRSRGEQTVTLGSADAKTPYDGVVYVRLRLSGILYPAFTTGIRTFHSVWIGRQNPRPSLESKALTVKLIKYQQQLEEAHAELVKKGGRIDVQAMMEAMAWLEQKATGLNIGRANNDPFAPVTLLRVYEEFMAWKETMIEPDHRKRSPDQISDETYKTYPKRWVMVQSYLHSIKRPRYPVHDVNLPFTNALNEWLRKQAKPDGTKYESATVNKVISLLKMLMTYAMGKGYVESNPAREFSCRGGSPANPKPLTESDMYQLETCDLGNPLLRHVCDSWLVAAELCLHHADFVQLKNMDFVTVQTKAGGTRRFIQHDRSKQSGTSLVQTVDITPRAERILAKWGGAHRLYYKSSTLFSKYLKKIAEKANLRDKDGELIGLQFGQGRDTGLTQRAVEGATSVQLSLAAGWSKPSYANRYIGNALEIMKAYVEQKEED
jgi:hypothetical protein